MKENKKNQGFKIRKIKRDIEHGCDNAIKHFGILWFSLLPDCFYGTVCMLFSVPVLIRGKRTRN